MNAKRFVKLTIASVAMVLVLITLTVVIMDPLCLYHKSFFGMYPEFYNERYIMAGIAKNFDYDCAIIGSSLSQNFRVSWFDEKFNCNTVKLAVGGLEPKEADLILNCISKNNGTPKKIFFEVRPRLFLIDDYDAAEDLPAYLYDDNILNDCKYVFNSAIWDRYMLNLKKSNEKNVVNEIDQSTAWNEEQPSGNKELALSAYKRPDISAPTHTRQEYEGYAKKNLEGIIKHIKENPSTEYYIYIPPVSVLYWDTVLRENNMDIVKSGLLYATEELLKYPNAKVFLFSNEKSISIIENLDNYFDDIHYNPEINEYMLECFVNGENELSKDNYITVLDSFFDELNSYDYESLFE